MGEIVKLQVRVPHKPTGRYLCGECDCGEFCMYTDGTVWCAECYAEITDITVCEECPNS